ncbi:DEAD-box ATP-dependent RNA helicase 50 [Lotus japonicus]|uniref:DEAD-box ATP-dependent RNA helicase 50 n=1 Tax=Lotus japonicus TaxID=34305 RepID=UPI00258FC906|nr:DEAD-box ATP-dependent RNA helicase 50 [Lotus japonicus]
MVVGVGSQGFRPPSISNLNHSRQLHSFYVSATNRQHNPPTTTDDNNLKQPSSSFGRLKAHQVKALIHRTKPQRRDSHLPFTDSSSIEEHEQAHQTSHHSAGTKYQRRSSTRQPFTDSTVATEREEAHQTSRHSGGAKYQRRSSTHQPFTDSTVENREREEAHQTSRHSGGRRPSSSSSSSSHSKLGRGWGDTITVPYSPMDNRKPSMPDNNFFSVKSFKDIGCSDNVIQSLQNQSFTRPSHVQAMAFGPVIAGKTCVISDQSGSGKTLAYLAPIIQRLKQEELEGRSKSSSQAPRVVILAPTAELASQVLDNCRSMSKSGVPFKSMVVTGGFRQRTQLESLQQGVDVLIATPGRFLFLIKEGFLQLTNLRCAVLDEVDILLGDEDFEGALQCLINSSLVDTQYLFVTATLPKNVYSRLVEVFPDCEMIMGPGMHRISSRLEEVLVDCSGEDGQEKTPDTAFLNKKAALLQLVEESPVPRTIVFCNRIETCRKVENALNRIDKKGTRIQVLPFHAAMTQESRLASREGFTRSPSKEVSQFMVCTDRASRGIDFAEVNHVILFDFPRDPSEYVRRVGRTARGARGQGKAFIFVVGKQVSLARKIMERNRKGHPLHDVPSAFELMR